MCIENVHRATDKFKQGFQRLMIEQRTLILLNFRTVFVLKKVSSKPKVVELNHFSPSLNLGYDEARSPLVSKNLCDGVLSRFTLDSFGTCTRRRR